MNKIKSSIAAIAVSVLTFPALVSAQLTPTGWNIQTAGNGTGLSNNSFYVVIHNLLMYLLGIVGVLAVVGFVISGIMYITAAGDEDRVDLAKKMLTYSIVGIVVALLGLVIVTALSYIITGTMF